MISQTHNIVAKINIVKNNHKQFRVILGNTSHPSRWTTKHQIAAWKNYRHNYKGYIKTPSDRYAEPQDLVSIFEANTT